MPQSLCSRVASTPNAYLVSPHPRSLHFYRAPFCCPTCSIRRRDSPLQGTGVDDSRGVASTVISIFHHYSILTCCSCIFPSALICIAEHPS